MVTQHSKLISIKRQRAQKNIHVLLLRFVACFLTNRQTDRLHEDIGRGIKGDVYLYLHCFPL